MRKVLVALVAVALVGCGVNADNVYDQPLPDRNDADALIEIRDAVKPEDQKAWGQVVMAMHNPAGDAVKSKTVGEAIRRMQTYLKCVADNDIRKIDLNDREVYNRMVRAQNACNDLPF